MKLLMIHFSALLLVVGLLFVGCNKNDNVLVNSEIDLKQTHTPVLGQTVENTTTFMVREYVKVTPKESAPYYEFRPALKYLTSITTLEALWGEGISGTFTTPESSRYEGDNLIETQNFKVEMSTRWQDITCNWWPEFKVFNGTYYHQNELFFGSVPCDDPKDECDFDPPQSFCITHGVLTGDDVISLSPNTTYTMSISLNGIALD